MLTTAIDIVRLKLTRRPPWSANEIAARQWAESKPLENDLTFIPETASFSRKTAASFMSPIATNFRKRPFRFLPTIAIRSRAGETSSDAGHPARPDRDASVGHVTESMTSLAFIAKTISEPIWTSFSLQKHPIPRLRTGIQWRYRPTEADMNRRSLDAFAVVVR
jgi:hypothetical protein